VGVSVLEEMEEMEVVLRVLDQPNGFVATSFWNCFRASSSGGGSARRVVAGAFFSVRMSGDRGRLLKPCLRSLNGGL
jgi:hypothetical protein